MKYPSPIVVFMSQEGSVWTHVPACHHNFLLWILPHASSLDSDVIEINGCNVCFLPGTTTYMYVPASCAQLTWGLVHCLNVITGSLLIQ